MPKKARLVGLENALGDAVSQAEIRIKEARKYNEKNNSSILEVH